MNITATEAPRGPMISLDVAGRARSGIVLAVFALAAACSTTPLPARSAPPDSGTLQTNTRAVLPSRYVPPDGCFDVRFEERSRDTRRWTYRCVVGAVRVQDFLGTVRTSALRQGWQECGPAWAFLRQDLSMGIVVDPGRPVPLPSPAVGRTDPGLLEVVLIIEQWPSPGRCG